MKLLKAKCYNPGNKVAIEKEPLINDIKFNIIKFNDKECPKDKKDKVVICCFSEFGCEIVGVMYAFNFIKKRFPDKYLIVAGWYGRSYLYQHLVDEFWEIDESFMWLREYARAFHHKSNNLKSLEKELRNLSDNFVASDDFGKMLVLARCKSCKRHISATNKINNCVSCKSYDIIQSVYGDVASYRSLAMPIPSPSQDKILEAKKYLGNNPVGIFARGRKCYGRNLPKEFYINLIKLLRDIGYEPIWLGEKQSVIECPVDDIVDFSRKEESRDLELTLAIIKQLNFTIQFWTASTRLSAIMNTPYILFESPDQIWGGGQEGIRLNLTTFGPKKLVISHYLNALDNQEKTLEIVNQAINELNNKNYNEIFALLENEDVVKLLKQQNNLRIGG